MFKRTIPNSIDMFASPSNLLTPRAMRVWDDPQAWHNQFYDLVTARIDERLFKPLYASNGAPSASVRTMVAMLVMKQVLGCSDEELWQRCMFDLQVRRALGVINLSDPVPSLGAVDSLRQRLALWEIENKVDLLRLCLNQALDAERLRIKVYNGNTTIVAKVWGERAVRQAQYALVAQLLRALMARTGNLPSKLQRQSQSLLPANLDAMLATSTDARLEQLLVRLGELAQEVLKRHRTHSAERQELEAAFAGIFTASKGQLRLQHHRKPTAKQLQWLLDDTEP